MVHRARARLPRTPRRAPEKTHPDDEPMAERLRRAQETGRRMLCVGLGRRRKECAEGEVVRACASECLRVAHY